MNKKTVCLDLRFPNPICLFTIFKSGGSSPPTSADSRLLDAAETLVTLQSVSSRGQGKYQFHDTKLYSILKLKNLFDQRFVLFLVNLYSLGIRTRGGNSNQGTSEKSRAVYLPPAHSSS